MIAVLRSIPGVDVIVQSLRLGDYYLNGWIFERKTLLDFAQSVIDGHLFSQVHRLACSNDQAAIILEGKSSQVAGMHVRREALQVAMISAALVFQIPVLRSTDPTESADFLIYAAQQLARSGTGAVVRHGCHPKQHRRRQLYILQGLPGIGPKTAERLLDRFGSVEAVMSASVEQLHEVDGIGAKTAKNIQSLIGA